MGDERLRGAWVYAGRMSQSPDSAYEPADYPPFAVTVDIALFAIEPAGERLQVLLVQRGEPPFKGAWALPGGFVGPQEGLFEAAGRELAEETGVVEHNGSLEQFGVYGEPARDPRMRVVTVAYCAVVPDPPSPVGGGDAAAAAMTGVEDIEVGAIDLAFDHARIVADAVEHVRSRLEYTALATAFCTPTFSIGQLRRIYEVVWGARLDAGNFQRNFRQNACFVRQDTSLADAPRVRGRPASQWALNRSVAGGNRKVLLERPLARRRQP